MTTKVAWNQVITMVFGALIIYNYQLISIITIILMLGV